VLATSRRIFNWISERYRVLERTYRHPLNRSSRFGALRDYFVWNAARYSLDAQFVLKLPEGLELIVGRSENHGTGIYIHCLHDFNEMAFLAHVMQSGDIFVDAGANVGLYSVWVSGVTGARTIALEPVPGTFETLQKNVRLNNQLDKIEMLRVALSDEPGELAMTTCQGGMNHVVFAPGNGMTHIPSDTLERILGDIEPYAMKIDVEGFELRVLHGAERILRNNSLHVIVIELQNATLSKYGADVRDVKRYIESFGFKSCVYDPTQRRLSETPAGQEDDFNVIFVRGSDNVRDRLASGKRITLRQFPDGI
jgi:FkbM family methyltransferase